MPTVTIWQLSSRAIRHDAMPNRSCVRAFLGAGAVTG
jgi:hypothetical protein